MRKTELVELLGRVPLFSECTKTDIRSVMRHSEELRADAGTDIVTQGRPGRVFYLLLHGEAEVRRNARRVAVLGPGDFFGELALLDPGPRNATVTATTDVTLLAISDRMLQVALRDLPRMRRGMLSSMAGRLRDLDRSGSTT
jgi:CRP/FNR family cyclic AMP-dependent transcriptional regulator